MELPVEHGLLLDNLLDLAHAPFTHTSTFAKGWSVPRFVPVIITVKSNQFSQDDKNFNNLSRMVPFIMFKIAFFTQDFQKKLKHNRNLSGIQTPWRNYSISILFYIVLRGILHLGTIWTTFVFQ